MNGQTHKHSFLEAVTNVVVGCIVAFVSQLVIFAYMAIPISYGQNVFLTLFFTAVSLVRSYLLRRYFNALTMCHGNILHAIVLLWAKPKFIKQ